MHYKRVTPSTLQKLNIEGLVLTLDGLYMCKDLSWKAQWMRDLHIASPGGQGFQRIVQCGHASMWCCGFVLGGVQTPLLALNLSQVILLSLFLCFFSVK